MRAGLLLLLMHGASCSIGRDNDNIAPGLLMIIFCVCVDKSHRPDRDFRRGFTSYATRC